MYNMSDEGLTGIREDARGFVGGKPILDNTRNNRDRIRFDIGCGKNETEKGRFTTWRHCVAYDKVADDLKLLAVGNLVKVSGWVRTECLRDDYYKPVLDADGRTKQKEYLILYKAEITVHERTPEIQPSLMAGVLV